MKTIIKKYGKGITYSDYLLILKATKEYYLEQSQKTPSYTLDKLHPFLMNTFIAFKRRGITDKEWMTLDREVRRMFTEGVV